MEVLWVWAPYSPPSLLAGVACSGLPSSVPALVGFACICPCWVGKACSRGYGMRIKHGVLFNRVFAQLVSFNLPECVILPLKQVQSEE